jgi:hypothetical protein
MQNFSILIFVLAFMAVNIMVFALRVSKNVLHSMRVSAKENMMTSRLLAKENTLVLQAAQLDSTTSSERLDQANLIHNQTVELDKFLGDLMVEIVELSHKDNLQAIDENGIIKLEQAFHLDNHNSTESVIFGSELEMGAGADLVESLEKHKELLLAHAGTELDRTISELLELSSTYPEEYTWLQQTFTLTPMVAALISLSNLQFKIHFLEGELLKEIL